MIMGSANDGWRRFLRLCACALMALLLSAPGCIAATGDDDEEAQEEDAEILEAGQSGGKPLACADPGALSHGGKYYLACTGGTKNGGHLPIYESSDMKKWKRIGFVFPKGSGKHPWGKDSWWAPELAFIGGQFVAYYTVQDASGKHRIGVATSANVAGPYQDIGQPLVDRTFGTIDPHLFDDGGQLWLYYKRASNGVHTTIFAQRLEADGLKKAGTAKPTLDFGLGWEGELVEAPWLVKHGDFYYMFYSANWYCNADYAVGVARSKSPDGPFVKRGLPILKATGAWRGPGHNSVIRDAENVEWMIYHAYDGQQTEPKCSHLDANPPRVLRRAAIDWKSGWPVLAPPERTCKVQCCDGTVKKLGQETRQDCKSPGDVCQGHGGKNIVTWGGYSIADSDKCQ
jgi:arabinan endo-1,5-alpha-L-arabinosidase